ncbi:MAG: hypothetical protein JAY60_18040 [Candidatus Thiodiazotropha weberae]|nr:hypothetical protein [Candidatus Thiodiazotropha weberae]
MLDRLRVIGLMSSAALLPMASIVRKPNRVPLHTPGTALSPGSRSAPCRGHGRRCRCVWRPEHNARLAT